MGREDEMTFRTCVVNIFVGRVDVHWGREIKHQTKLSYCTAKIRTIKYITTFSPFLSSFSAVFLCHLFHQLPTAPSYLPFSFTIIAVLNRHYFLIMFPVQFILSPLSLYFWSFISHILFNTVCRLSHNYPAVASRLLMSCFLTVNIFTL